LNEETDSLPYIPKSLGTVEVAKDSSTYHGELGQPINSEAAAIHELIKNCPPLDLNSIYAYLLLTQHFSETCVVARGEQGIDGFVSGYVPPNQPDVLFIWQVAVHSRARGQGLGRAMLNHLLQRPKLADIAHIETTIGPDNLASRGMFASLAREHNASLTEHAFFDCHLFGSSGHEEERLIRVKLPARHPDGRRVDNSEAAHASAAGTAS